MKVERLHRDVYSGVLCHYASLFSHMENHGILNADNEEHLFVLHQVFLPRINRSLDEFVNQWNSHPVSSAGNQSPEQMFISGSLDAAVQVGQAQGVHCPVVDSSETLGTGFDDDELPHSDYVVHDEDYAVFVPQIESNIPNHSFPHDQFLEEDGNHGINHFLSYLDIIQGQHDD